MGFDIYGANPSSEKGEHFRNNVWWWRPLWSFVCDNCSDTLDEADITGGHFNDGHFIDGPKALHISEKLDALLRSGAVREYEQGYMHHIRNLPDEVCRVCGGAGWRDLPKELVDLSREGDPMSYFKKWAKIWSAFCKNPDEYEVIRTTCKGCNGTGKTSAWASGYPFGEENVKKFAEFCSESGGFTIN